jgi:hypothetical protein
MRPAAQSGLQVFVKKVVRAVALVMPHVSHREPPMNQLPVPDTSIRKVGRVKKREPST